MRVVDPTPRPLQVEIVNDGGYDWGNLLVQVLIAIATIATLIWAIRAARDENQRASRDRQEALTAEARHQASRISAWERQWTEPTDDDDPSATTEVFAADTGEVSRWRERRTIAVHNASDAPVYDVSVHFFDVVQLPERLTQVWQHAVLPPNPEPRVQEVTRAPGAGLSEDVSLRVVFRDAANRYWDRDSSGILHRRDDLDRLTPDQHLERRGNEYGAATQDEFERLTRRPEGL